MKTHFISRSTSHLTALIAFFSLCATLPAQVSVNMTTTVTATQFEGQNGYSIKQRAQANPDFSNTGGVLFNDIQKLGSVSSGAYATNELKAVNLTFTHFASGALFTITNNNVTPYTFTVAQSASADVRFTSTTANPQPKWNWGLGTASTLDGSTFETVDGNDFFRDFAADVYDDANGQYYTLAANGGTLTQVGDLSASVTSNVDSFRMANYTGAGTWDFEVVSKLFTTTSGIGGGISYTVVTPVPNYFVEVEYIVIPEVSSLALMGLALGAGGLLCVRFRRKA